MSLPNSSSGSTEHTVENIHARRIFDSRGRPTVEVDVLLKSGAFGRAAVPSGASTGSAEACELRDGGSSFGGRDVSEAVAHVNTEIAAAMRGRDACDQRAIDETLSALDGTISFSRLGANALLGSSLAVCRAAAESQRIPLYAHLSRLAEAHGINVRPSLPVPMVNIFSGGMHASHGMDIQDFLIVPLSSRTFEEAIDVIWRVRESATVLLAQRGISTLLADEGGLSPGYQTAEEALDALVDSIELAGFRPARDVGIALDVASTRLWNAASGRYEFARAGQSYGPDEMIALMGRWIADYPVISIEDGLHEESWREWSALTARHGETQILGDDFFATNAQRIKRGIAECAANAVLIKVNQNGTLSGTLEALACARDAAFATIVSARSGETEDAFISDLAVATGSGQIKIGSFRCSDRLSKYNQLARLAETVGSTLSLEALARLRGAVSDEAFTA